MKNLKQNTQYKYSRKTTVTLIAISVMVVLTAFFAWFFNNHISVNRYDYSSEKIQTEFDGYKILQISDLHNKSFGKNNRILLEKIEKEKPDIIVITGDVVDCSHTDEEVALNFISDASKLAKVYLVSGNHELNLPDEREFLEEKVVSAGAVLMDGEIIPIKKNGGKIYLSGVYNGQLKDFSYDGDYLNILLAHRPDLFEDYSELGADIVFSGHTHGGQICLPFTNKGLYAPNQGFFPEYGSGVFDNGKTVMYLSRGLGNSVIPLRIFDNPEIITVTLKKSNG